MDFTLTEAQRELGGLVRRIATDRLTPDRLAEAERSRPHFDRELWRELADVGVLGATLPETVGNGGPSADGAVGGRGGGLDFLELCAVAVELGRAVAPVPYLACAVSAQAIAHFGTDAQRARWAGPAAAGDLVLTAALTEDLADSPEVLGTRAEPDGTGWRLTGAKAVVPFATVAEAILVPAATADGNRLFAVEPGDEGVVVVAQRVVDGDEEAALDLVGVRLDSDRLIGGADVVHWLLARATVALCARQLGVLERALELTADYARERRQFGRPIGSFQAVTQRLADAYLDVEAVRLTMWEAAWRIAEGRPCPTEIATAKFWAADAGHRVAHTAVHVHGGTGIDTGSPTHRYFVAAKRGEFALGGATDQLRRIGRELATTPA